MFVALRIYLAPGEDRRQALQRECDRCGITFPIIIPLPIPCYPIRYRNLWEIPLQTIEWCPGVYEIEYVLRPEARIGST